MVKTTMITLASIFLISGCASTKEVAKVETRTIIQSLDNQEILSEDERKLFYRGNYDINYKPPRVVWFKPLLTEKGNVVSERTITLAPKDLKWTDEHNMNVGDKFKELVGDKK